VNAAGASVTATAALTVTPAATGSFATTGSLAAARYGATATLLPNGKVLVAGGFGQPSCCLDVALTSAELFDPAANGGAGGLTAPAPPSSADLYDPSTSAFTATGAMTSARQNAAVALLANGQVLIAGGYNSSVGALSSADLFDAGGNSGAGSFTQTTPGQM